MTYESKLHPGLFITYDFIPGCHGARDSLGGRAGCGPPIEPDEPAYCEITSVKDQRGNEVINELSEEKLDSLADEALEQHREQPIYE